MGREKDNMGRGKRQAGTASGETIKRLLPKEITQYVQGRTIDLSSTSVYYLRFARAALHRLQPVLREREEKRYELKKRFFDFYMNCLWNVYNLHYGMPYMEPADFPAEALYRAGMMYGVVRLAPADPAGIDIMSELWPKTRPTSEAWIRLGDLTTPMGRGRAFENPPLYLHLKCNRDRTTLPKLTIDIEGEPVAVLMRAMHRIEDVTERRAARKEAKKIWDVLLTQLSLWAGIAQPSRGKPRENLGRRVAFEVDYRGFTLPQVEGRLCPRKHEQKTSAGNGASFGLTLGKLWIACPLSSPRSIFSKFLPPGRNLSISP
jgi:hypothetical protein